MIEAASVSCPYCGESFETTVDLSAGDQSYIEDCYVCCQPINFHIQVSGGHAGEEAHLAHIDTRRDDE